MFADMTLLLPVMPGYHSGPPPANVSEMTARGLNTCTLHHYKYSRLTYSDQSYLSGWAASSASALRRAGLVGKAQPREAHCASSHFYCNYSPLLVRPCVHRLLPFWKAVDW